ncbi:unnamed protein product, partial [Allacma fusca]
IATGADYVGKSGSIEVIRWQTMDRVLFVLFYDLNLIQNNETAWQENTRLMFGPLNKLINRLAVVDCVYHPLQCYGLNQTVIKEFRRGLLTRSIVSALNIENPGNQQCLFESLSLDVLQKKFRDYEESTKLTIESLNATIAELLRNNSGQYVYNVVNTESPSRPVAKASTRQNITSEFLYELTNSPRARLYSNKNHTGQYEEYQAFSAWNKGASNGLRRLVFGNLSRNALSIYLQQDGVSESVKIVKKFKDNETAEFSPDWVLFGGVDNYMESYHLWDKENPITNFKQGSNGRIEYVRAFVYQMHLRNEIQVNDLEMSSFTRRQYEQFEMEEGDTVGYAIPLKFGGPEDEIYNIFPQSETCQAKWEKQLDEALEDNLTEGFYGLATIYLNFMYSNTNASRPFAFAYHISINGQSDVDRVRYGVIEN